MLPQAGVTPASVYLRRARLLYMWSVQLVSRANLGPKLKPATYRHIRSRNLYQKLVPEPCKCVGQSGTSFFSDRPTNFLPAHKVSGTWHEPCNVIGRRVVFVQETVMNLRQIYAASFWCKFLGYQIQVYWACVAGIRSSALFVQICIACISRPPQLPALIRLFFMSFTTSSEKWTFLPRDAL